MGMDFQLFLSYTRQDEDKVEWLYNKLEEAGYKPWMDTKVILGGENWEIGIKKAIKESVCFLACLSKNSVSKRGVVQKEIRYAMDVLEGMLDKDIYLIPVRLEECEVPEKLRNIQWVDLYEKNGLPSLIKSVQAGIERRFPNQKIEINEPKFDDILKGQEIGYLREVLERSKICKQYFKEVESLAYGIYRDQKYVPLPYFTDDAVTHCWKVEESLNQIITGIREEERKILVFDPTPEEAMYLLGGIWLRDLGMFYGIFKGERADDIKDNPELCAKLHREHEIRTVKHLSSVWDSFCSWNHVEKGLLTRVCRSDRLLCPIEDIEIEMPGTLTKTPIRLRTLAALLRLADACNIERTWAPGKLQELYDKLQIPARDVCFRDFPRLITNIQFNHSQHQIKIDSIYPKPFTFTRGRFDLGEIIDIACKDIEEALGSVQTTLQNYRNTAFREIFNDKRELDSSLGVSEYCLGSWPYFLHKPYSATESAAALAQMLLFEVQETKTYDAIWQRRVLGMISETINWRQFDSMIRNLQDKVGKKLTEIVEKADDEKSGAVDNLKDYLEDYLSKIESNCEKMTEAARGLIKSEDVLIIHGYSIKVERFLETIKPPTHQGAIYVVNCNKPDGDELHFGLHENDRMLAKLIDFKYRVYSIGLESLSQVLADLKRHGHVCKMLMGTHAILENNNLLCKAGTHSLVLTGKAHEVPVIAFASTDKFLQNGSREKDFDVNGYLAVKEKKVVDQKHAVSCTWSKMDKVPIELVDHFVTEAGLKPRIEVTPVPESGAPNKP